jgi:ubiquinone/menaquinone biosynthesis C-methylase UbiE
VTVLAAQGFDHIASEYEKLWSGTKAGQFQREAVWRYTAHLFRAGSHVLDLGCGTGDDALWLAAHGVIVTGIDASAEMARVACERGVDARHCAIENIREIRGTFDAVWSNFGALNCVEHLRDLRQPLARAINPEGWLVVCMMSRVCLWETIWYTLHGNFRKATRRWSGETSSSVARRVFYPTIRSVCRAFAPEFTLESLHGVGFAVPPSYVSGISNSTIDRLAAIDKHLASWPILRSLSDHHLLIFRKCR